MDRFDLKTKIFFGDNALDRLRDNPYDRILVIADPFVVESGMINSLTKRLDEAHKEYHVYSDVIPDPPLDKIAYGVQFALGYKPDAIVAVGGGAAIDSAKSIKEFSEKIGKNGEIKLIAIPTTSGSGSEVTSYAVVTDTFKNNLKCPIVTDNIIPNEAILDAELTMSVPPTITADTGMDVITHAIEAYVSEKANAFTDALAEKSLELCAKYLVRAYKNGKDVEARQQMHVASCLAGIAFSSCSLGINHSMAHQLGGHFHIAHGRANAILLPHIIAFNSRIDAVNSDAELPACAAKYCAAAAKFGVTGNGIGDTVRKLVDHIKNMMFTMNIPMTVSLTGKCTKEEYMQAIADMVQGAMTDGCTEFNPRKTEPAEFAALFIGLW